MQLTCQRRICDAGIFSFLLKSVFYRKLAIENQGGAGKAAVAFSRVMPDCQIFGRHFKIFADLPVRSIKGPSKPAISNKSF
tara:strand:+ start:383 stop:625 length:243 start_codon:yes stop_codon:yes gene_type:complete